MKKDYIDAIHICEKGFDQYELELHFLNSHDEMEKGTDKENDKCHDDVHLKV